IILLLTNLLLIIFYFSPHLPDLHSFPTRRSSDLFLTFGEYRLLAKEGATIGTAGVQAWVRGASGGCGASSDGDARIGLYERRPLDRKSTRLNSSHVSISYAVFCLKKKSNA